MVEIAVYSVSTLANIYVLPFPCTAFLNWWQCVCICFISSDACNGYTNYVGWMNCEAYTHLCMCVCVCVQNMIVQTNTTHTHTWCHQMSQAEKEYFWNVVTECGFGFVYITILYVYIIHMQGEKYMCWKP